MEDNRRNLMHIFIGMMIYFSLLIINWSAKSFFVMMIPNSELWNFFIDIIIYSVTLILPSVYISKTLGVKITFKNFGGFISTADMRNYMYILAVPLTLTAVTAIGYITSAFIPETENPYPVSVSGILLMFISSVILPAVLEEILFRGLIMRIMLKVTLFYAVLISASFFALIHIDLYRIPYALTAGIFIGIFTAATGSLRLAVICHSVNNLRSYFFYIMSVFLEKSIFQSVTLMIDSIVAAAAIIITFLTIRHHYKTRIEDNLDAAK